MDWRNIVDNIYMLYNEFIDWYLVQPIYGQILAIIGIIALLTLAVILIYYIIKGIAYLIFYTLKGIYYLLKGIGFGIFKLGDGFYNLVSGKHKSKKQIENNMLPIKVQISRINTNTLFCNECGRKFSEKMMTNILSNRTVFCVNCGKEYNLIEFQKYLTLTH
ncbi:MAG: hypothetical protein ACFFG0_32985 [Candidatus Thorarchaeota archaeon]